MVKYFLMPDEVWYYVVIPMLVILLIYFVFYLLYHKKKGTYYYNYVVDYVYSTLGIIFCSLLFCLLLGYSIATIQILYMTEIIKEHLLLVIFVLVLPFIPTGFLIYILRIYVKNLKRKEHLDEALEVREKELLENK